MFIPLHSHTHYSLLDGLCKPKELVERYKELGFTAGAITDHGNLSGVVEFAKACKDNNIKPILGCEFYLEEHHLVVLAKNKNGWLNLVKLSSVSNHPDRIDGKPRIYLSDLAKVSGLIGMSGHHGSELSNILFKEPASIYRLTYEESKAILTDNHIELCVSKAKEYQDIFGVGNFFIEIHNLDNNSFPASRLISEKLREVSKITGIPCVAISDSHYCRKDDAPDQRFLVCVNLKTTLQEVKQKALDSGNSDMTVFLKSNQYYVPSEEEILLHNTKEEVDNTLLIANMCEEYTILAQPILPRFDCPNSLSNDEYLRELCRKGWKEKIQKILENEEDKKIYTDRVKQELDIISRANLSGYFLVVQDYCNYAKSQGWLIGPGRGCFLPDTRIKMGDGTLLPIISIKENDIVIDAYGKKQEVLNKFIYEIDEDIIEIEFENNIIIRCTKDHKFLTKNRGFIEAQNLLDSDEVVEV